MAKESAERDDGDEPGDYPRADECVVPIGSGWICSPAYPAPCDYVRVVDASGAEYYFDQEEFRGDTAMVLGALMGSLKAL